MKENAMPFVSCKEESIELKRLAEKSVKKSLNFLLYSAFFVILALLFLAFAAYTVRLFIQETDAFQAQMLIYVLVPILGAVLSVVFIVQKFRRLTENNCEAEHAVVVFEGNKIAVQGLAKKQPENSMVSRLLREEPKEGIDRYEMEIEKIKFYAYQPESGKFRWILGRQDFPDLIVPQGESLNKIMDKLEELGIRRTGFID